MSLTKIFFLLIQKVAIFGALYNLHSTLTLLHNYLVDFYCQENHKTTPDVQILQKHVHTFAFALYICIINQESICSRTSPILGDRQKTVPSQAEI